MVDSDLNRWDRWRKVTSRINHVSSVNNQREKYSQEARANVRQSRRAVLNQRAAEYRTVRTRVARICIKCVNAYDMCSAHNMCSVYAGQIGVTNKCRGRAPSIRERTTASKYVTARH